MNIYEAGVVLITEDEVVATGFSFTNTEPTTFKDAQEASLRWALSRIQFELERYETTGDQE